jgi:hypothetical protein
MHNADAGVHRSRVYPAYPVFGPGYQHYQDRSEGFSPDWYGGQNGIVFLVGPFNSR